MDRSELYLQIRLLPETDQEWFARMVMLDQKTRHRLIALEEQATEGVEELGLAARQSQEIDHDLPRVSRTVMSQRGRLVDPNSLRQRVLRHLSEHGGDSTVAIATALGEIKTKVHSSLGQLKWSKLIHGGTNAWWSGPEQTVKEVAA